MSVLVFDNRRLIVRGYEWIINLAALLIEITRIRTFGYWVVFRNM